jgi:L-malate glycosyltransferase
MKILHFIDSLNIGGSEGQTAEVAARQAAAGHAVSIGCLHLDGPNLSALREKGVACQEFPLRGSLFGVDGIRSVVALARFIRRGKFDVVHTHDLYSNLVAVPAAAIARTPRIISSRRDLASWWWYTPRNRRILRWIQRLSHVVIANSESVKRFLVDEDGFSPAHVSVVYNAVDPTRFASRSDRGILFPGRGPDTYLFAVVANMHTHTKGHKYVIEAVASLCKSHPEAHIVLVGDGALRSEFELQAKTLGVSENCVFLGARADVPAILSVCDAAILPSLAEGFPNSVLEYLAAGKPVIASSVGGIPEVIEHGVTGLLVPPKEAGQLEDAMRFLLENREAAQTMARRGQDLVGLQFTYDALLSRLESIYRGTGS